MCCGNPGALSLLLGKLCCFFSCSELFISWKMQLWGEWRILEFRLIPPNRKGQNENTEMLKIFWVLITSRKVKGEIYNGWWEDEQVQLFRFVKQSSRWEAWLSSLHKSWTQSWVLLLLWQVTCLSYIGFGKGRSCCILSTTGCRKDLQAQLCTAAYILLTK